MDVDSKKRERDIYRVTIYGSAVNTVLLVFKFIAGILGGSAAMIADAVHSLSDFLTDIMVLIFVRLSSRPIDKTMTLGMANTRRWQPPSSASRCSAWV